MHKKILVIDDSALVRKQLTQLLEENDFEVDTAKNGQEGVEKALNQNYDAITMDINMPVLNGLDATRAIMESNPTPILMVSSLTTEDSKITFDSIDLGAIDVVAKPGTMRLGGDSEKDEIVSKLKIISKIPKRRLKLGKIKSSSSSNSAKNIQEPKKATSVVLIGSSTGGPGLIEDIVCALPVDYPHAVCVVQHMPERFTASFAQRLDKASKISVKESKHNEDLCASTVYIAKGGEHLTFTKKLSGRIAIKHIDNMAGRFFCPSVDEMFLSAHKVFGRKDIYAAILTGIGDDGAAGMVELKRYGVHTLGQNEESCSVYGMPKVAKELGGISEELDFSQILKKIVSYGK